MLGSTAMKISVLLAGDTSFRETVGTALEGEYAAIEVDSVNDAAEALLAGRPALALIDLRGRSAVGLAICRRIKGAAATRLLPIVACADAGQEALIEALDAGADQVVGFPPPIAELKARV